ncbi:hypothetical protein [Blastococcus sp. TF02A-35]|uniref:hypothetical protein n=1 Tax=Blastococcus sp. TF02A-35 TaxID=2559612 RepID=UPI001073054F|nr:hypothetical protein [Blastococcus sp. TF02A_35]TFV52901.1 hypothetical protein E4P43_04715 [Blastococcus sp. TF02A_35]
MRRGAGEGAGWGWSLLLPPGWSRLPTEAVAGRAAARRLVGEQLAHLPRDRTAQLRRRVERELRQLLAEARGSGAGSVYVLAAPVRGLPVSATCSVVVVRGAVGDDRLVAELARVLGRAEGLVDLGVRPLAGLPALRRHRRRTVPLGDGGSGVHTAVDWAVPLPDGGGAVLLSFGTVTEPVAEQLVALFDAMAQTLELTAPEDRGHARAHARREAG